MKQKEVILAGNEWTEKSVRDFPGSPFKRIGSDWMLISAGNVETDKGKWNTMTASWGGLGVLWKKDVSFIFIRPSRYTFGFANDAELFTLSFFDESYRSALNLCGEKSGRDMDKAQAAGLTPLYFADGPERGAVSFKEARDILVCKKMYAQDLDPALFLEPSIEENYKGFDYHRLYVGEVICYKTRV